MSTNNPASGGAGLGRQLLELYPSRTVGIILCASALFGVFRPEQRSGLVLVCVIFLVIGALLITHRVALFDEGIRSSVAWEVGVRQVRFADVVVFTYETRRVFINLQFSGYHTRVGFVDGAGRKMSVTVLQPAQNSMLEAMRNHLAETIATRWAETLRSGSSVRWSKSITFTTEGLEVTRRGLRALRGDGKVLIPYAGDIDLELGKGSLTLIHDHTPACTFETSVPNFYPGLALLQHLRSRARASRSSSRATA